MTGTEVVNWQDKLAAEAKEVAALERPKLSQISLRAGVMTYQQQKVPGNKMEAIVVAAVFENKYFDGPFDPNNYQSPVCYALSTTGEEMVPHADSKEPQADRCSNCEKSKWNSAGGGSKGKACKEVRRLALLPKSALEDGNVATAEMALLSIPVTSVRNWGTYINGLAAEHSRPPWAVLTEVRAEPDPKTQFQVRFETKGLVGEEHLAAVYKRVKPASDVLMTPYDETGTVAGVADPLPGDPNKKKKY